MQEQVIVPAIDIHIAVIFTHLILNKSTLRIVMFHRGKGSSDKYISKTYAPINRI